MRSFHCVDICFQFCHANLMLSHTGGDAGPRALAPKLSSPGEEHPTIASSHQKGEGSMMSVARVTVAALACAALLGTAIAQAAPVTVNIGFAFTAGGRSMPAGKYQVDIKGWDGPIVLRGDTKDSEAVLSVLTRLGRHDNDQEPELVFDKLGTTLHLSEIWLPGEDGYLLVGTKEKHDHVVLGGPRGKK